MLKSFTSIVQTLDANDVCSPSTLNCLTNISSNISQLALFSPNESLSELSTQSLSFLLLDYYIALAYASTPSTSRTKSLELSIKHFSQFLETCGDYGLDVSLPGRSDASSIRANKIAQYKAEKALQTSIDTITALLHASTRGEDGDGAGVHDDTLRTLTLDKIALSVYKSHTAISLSKSELNLLNNAPPPSPSDPNKSDIDDLDSRLEVLSFPTTGPLISADGKPLRPFTLTNQRSEILAGVFRPGHSLPTMTLDEYLDAEMERGNIISGGGPQAEKTVVEATELEQLLETYKAREKDDFRDDNPKGWGNKGGNVG